MNVYKKAVEEQELTLSILFDIGAIKSCPAHGDYYYYTGMEQSKAYQFASTRYKQLIESDDVPQSFRDCIKAILDEAGQSSECPFCQKAFNE